MQPVSPKTTAPAWRLQDAKAQFSAVVEGALRGVPQHVTRRGKQAVVVVSSQDFEALQGNAANRTHQPTSFVTHLLAMPKTPSGQASKYKGPGLQPREIDLS